MAAQQDRIDELVAQWSAERPDLDTDVMAIVGRYLAVAALINRGLDEFAAEHGLDRGQGDVLLTLRRSGKPYRLSPSRLTDSLLVTSGTMTNRLDRLQAMGMLERKPNPHDRRGMDVQLTRKGLALTEKLVGRHVANEERMLEPLTAREREQLVQTTRKLLAHLSK